MNTLSKELITPQMTDRTFRLLSRKYCLAVLRWLATYPEGSILADIQLGIQIRTRETAKRLLTDFIEVGWVQLDEETRKYCLTEVGQRVLDFAESQESSIGNEGAGEP